MKLRIAYHRSQMLAVLLIGLALESPIATFDRMVGQPADIAPSAYQYRADRKPDANPPESWIALEHFANLPLNKPVDLSNSAIRRALCGLLWEEIRPVETLELTWPPSGRIPPADAVAVSALMNQGASSSWWNNLGSVKLGVKPMVSHGGRTYTYSIGQNTCGLVVSLANDDASRFDVPTARVLVPDTWKKMEIEVEWGFDKANERKDYGGRMETYDGRIDNLQPLDAGTSVTGETAWRSQGAALRRGIKFSLLYIGTSKWRKQQQYTTQPDDVARTIVTIWTKGGSFSFLAADLENGPILAPEYGFFVRRTSSFAPPAMAPPLRVVPIPLQPKMNEIAGDARLKGWGSDDTPWFGINPTDQPVAVRGIDFPAKCAAMHPGEYADVVAEWRSPINGKVSFSGSLTHAQTGGKGIEWWVASDTPHGRQILAHGTTDGAGSAPIASAEPDNVAEASKTPTDAATPPVPDGQRTARSAATNGPSRWRPRMSEPTPDRNALLAPLPSTSVSVAPGDSISLIIGPKGDHRSCTMILDWTIKEEGGQARTWNLAKDVSGSPATGRELPEPAPFADFAALRTLSETRRSRHTSSAFRISANPASSARNSPEHSTCCPALIEKAHVATLTPQLSPLSAPQLANPEPDSYGNQGVWRFCSEMPMFQTAPIPSDPPINLASNATSAKEFEQELLARNLKTIREQARAHTEQTWEAAVTETRGPNLPPIPAPPPGSEPSMRVEVPSERLTAQWNLGAWHLIRHCGKNPKTGKLWFNDYPYGILAAETYMVLDVLDLMGSHEAAADGYDQWLALPLDRNPPGSDALPAHPVGLFSEGHGALTYAEGPDGYGGQMDGIHAFGPGSIGWALAQHYWLTGDKEWLKANAARIGANAEWMLRQRHVIADSVPGGDRLWSKGLQPALQVTPDSGGLWMQFYECEAYYWAFVSRWAKTLEVVDPVGGEKLERGAEAYRKDLRAAVERSIALSPVVPVRNGTFHSVIPFACYVRGLSTGAWGWQRDGSGSHVGPLYWDTVQTAAALISPAGLLPPSDVRVQGYLDVLEDRLLLENQNVGNRDWFFAGWQYQGGLERTPNMHLAADDIPVFLRSFLNCYAVDILPNQGYVFNEHAVHGPPDKIFEEAAFLERFRNLLVMEDGDRLWLARGTPRAWLEQGKRVSVQNAPTHFGEISYEIASDVANGRVSATISMPARGVPKAVFLRLRHPNAARIRSVTVNGRPWKEFDPNEEIVRLQGVSGKVAVNVQY